MYIPAWAGRQVPLLAATLVARPPLSLRSLPARLHRLLAVGRDAVTLEMGLDNAGVAFDAKTGKITAEGETTNVPHIYAIGDVLESRQVRAAPGRAPRGGRGQV